MNYNGCSCCYALSLCPLAIAGRLLQGLLSQVPSGRTSAPVFLPAPPLPSPPYPEFGQVTLRRNLLFVQAFNHVEVLSVSVFGELGYMSIEEPWRGVIHHEILVKTQRDLSLFHLEVHLFLITAVMHYYKLLEGLKQYKFSQLQFWRPEVQNQFHLEKKSRCQEDWFLLEILWEKPFIWLSQHLEIAYIPCFGATILSSKPAM